MDLPLRETPVDLDRFEITKDNILIYDNGSPYETLYLTFRGPFDTREEAEAYFFERTRVIHRQ